MIEISFQYETGALTASANGLAKMMVQYDSYGNPVNASFQSAHGETLEQRSQVVSITDGSQAKQLGLKPGDVIQSYNGREIKAKEELVAATNEPCNTPCELVVRRSASLLKFHAQPGRLDIELNDIFKPVPDQKPSSQSCYGQP